MCLVKRVCVCEYILKHAQFDARSAQAWRATLGHPGVIWHAKMGKWMGKVLDRSVRLGKGPKQVHLGYFPDEQACADACAAKRAEVEAAIAQKLHAMAQEMEHTRNLPLRPKRAADAAPDTAYYGEKFKGAKKGEPKDFGPTRFVRAANESKPGGFDFQPCCRANLDSGAPCTQQAQHDGKHCFQHGGGFRVGKGRGNAVCTHCKSTQINQKRQPQHGGNGLCPACEKRLTEEAEANGYEGPIQSLRWEEQVFNLLLPLLTYADGVTRFPPDQRDERRGGGLGTSSTKKRRRECETTTNRFPDCLWVLRDESARAVLVVIVEVDEHSHADRDPACESGKLDDTFQALQDRLAKEGAARGSVARHDATMVPIVTSASTRTHTTRRWSSSPIASRPPPRSSTRTCTWTPRRSRRFRRTRPSSTSSTTTPSRAPRI